MSGDFSWVSEGVKLLALNGSVVEITRVHKRSKTFEGAILGKEGNKELSIEFNFDGKNIYGIENFELDISDSANEDQKYSFKLAV